MPEPKRPLRLTPGRDLATLTANSLALIKAGWAKGQAMAAALHHAGYKPPASPAPTKSSSDAPSPTPPPDSRPM
jgi:hypothetical protein